MANLIYNGVELPGLGSRKLEMLCRKAMQKWLLKQPMTEQEKACVAYFKGQEQWNSEH